MDGGATGIGAAARPGARDDALRRRAAGASADAVAHRRLAVVARVAPDARRRLRGARGRRRGAGLPPHGRGDASRRSARAVPAGEAVCHLAVAPDGGSLVAAAGATAASCGCRSMPTGRPSRRRRRARDRSVRPGCRVPRRVRRAASISPRRPARCARLRERVRAPRAGYDAERRVRATRAPTVPADATAVSRAHPAVFLPGGARRDDRPRARPRAVLARRRRRAPARARHVVLPRGTRPAAHGVAPERSPLRRHRALAARSSRSRPTPRALAHRRRARRSAPARCRATRRPSSRPPATATSSTPGCAAATRSPRCACAGAGDVLDAGRARRGGRRLAAPPRRRPRHPAGRRSALGRGRLAHPRPAHRRARAGCGTASRRRSPTCLLPSR